jgi:hypothetical protein
VPPKRFAFLRLQSQRRSAERARHINVVTGAGAGAPERRPPRHGPAYRDVTGE